MSVHCRFTTLVLNVSNTYFPDLVDKWAGNNICFVSPVGLTVKEDHIYSSLPIDTGRGKRECLAQDQDYGTRLFSQVNE